MYLSSIVTGKFLAKFGSDETGAGQLEDPEHLAVDADGNVYVSDRKNNKILVYAPKTTG